MLNEWFDILQIGKMLMKIESLASIEELFLIF